LKFRSPNKEDHIAVRKWSINVTELVSQYLNDVDHVLDLKPLKPMHIKFGDPAPRSAKVLYISYIPSKSQEVLNQDPAAGRLTMGPKTSLKFLKPSRVLSKCDVQGSDIVLKCYPYQDIQDTSPFNLFRGGMLQALTRDMDLNLNRTEDYLIKCVSAEEAEEIKRHLDKYIADLNPDIISAKFGAGPRLVDVSSKLKEYVHLRRLSRLRTHEKIAPEFQYLLATKEQKDPVPGKEKNVYVKFRNSKGYHSKIFKDKYSIILE